MDKLRNDAAKRKEMENRIHDIDEDDISVLPPINEQHIRQVIRKLHSGESLGLFQSMKVGAYKKDLVQAILQHKYSSTAELFELLDVLVGCADDFAKVLAKYTDQTSTELLEFFLHSKEPVPGAVERQKLHFEFVVNLKLAGFDAKSALLQSSMLNLCAQLQGICKQLDTILVSGLSTSSLSDNFKYNLVDYIKAFSDSFVLLADTMFGVDGFDTPFIMDVAKENFTALLNDKADIPVDVVQNKTTQLYCKKLFAMLKALFGQAFMTFKNLGQSIEQLAKNTRNKNEAQKKEIKDVVKIGSFLAQALNNLFESVGFEKVLLCAPILTDEEELLQLSLLQPEIRFGETKITDKYRVYCFDSGEPSVLLQSSNACQIELDFEYPSSFFRNNIEELAQLKLKLQFDNLQKIDLIPHLMALLEKCSSFDDVEYLAFSLYKQSEDIDAEDFVFNVGRAIGRPWRFQNIPHIAHFIATLAYNGIELNFVEQNTRQQQQAQKSTKTLYAACCTQSHVQFSEILPLCQFIREMLQYRLISTQQVLSLAQAILKKISAIKVKPNMYANDGDLAKYAEYFCTLIRQVYEFACLFDDSFAKLVGGAFEQTLSVVKKLQTQTDDEKDALKAILGSLEQTIALLLQKNGEIAEIRKNIQKKLEDDEKKRKRELFMQRLKEKNPKLYRREYEKEKALQEKLEKEQAEAEEKQKQKAEEKQNLEPKTLDGISTEMYTALVLGKYEEFVQKVQEISKEYIAYETNKIKAKQIELQAQAGETAEKITYKSGDESKMREKIAKTFFEQLQTQLTYQTLDSCALLYSAAFNDKMFKLYLNKINFVQIISESNAVDRRTLLVKLMLAKCGLIKPEQLKQTAVGVLNAVQFTQKNNKHLRAEEEPELGTKALFLGYAARFLNDAQLAGAAIVCFKSLEDSYLFAPEINILENKFPSAVEGLQLDGLRVQQAAAPVLRIPEPEDPALAALEDL